MNHRQRVVDFWDAHVVDWLRGGDPLVEPLPQWFASYSDRGRGAVTREGFVEPFIGDLAGGVDEPRLVVLGLNPGRYEPRLQSRAGLFADENRAMGGYATWSCSAPYLRDPWNAVHGPNRYYVDRLRFTGRWLRSADPKPNDMLVTELYPWHSTAVTGVMRPPADTIKQFVWDPISELNVPVVFAFGREWDVAAAGLRLPQLHAYGQGGKDYGSAVVSRCVRVYGSPSGQALVVEWHSGSAGPPSALETDLLRSALVELL